MKGKNMHCIDLEHQAKFERVWDKGHYRNGSTAQRLVDIFLPLISEKETINDYGSGTGRAEVETRKQRPNQRITMIDIAENALELDAIRLLEQPGMKFIHADLSNLEGVLRADWGLCINVLMTVQIHKLNLILQQIANTCNNLFFEAYDLPDFRLGMDMTTVKLSKDEWQKKLSEHWNDVQFVEYPQNKRRYIFICRK